MKVLFLYLQQYGGDMISKDIWKKNVESYSRDAVFTHRFAYYSASSYTKWIEALYKNEIIFIGGGKSFQIDDFSSMDFGERECNHPEWIQQINRFHWMTYAAVEFIKTGSDHMARLVHDTIQAWMDYWPNYGDRTDIYPFRQHEFWDPMINTPIRLGFGKGCGWVGCLPAFFDHPLFTDEFIEKVHDSIIWQLKPMVFNNREKGGEHNWRANELDCLLFMSCVFPDARNYIEYAVENLNDTFRAQFERDGSHIEHTPDYHMWMIELFSGIYLLGEKRPELGIDFDGHRIVKALDYAIDSRSPDRRSFGINDSWPWHPDNDPDGPRHEKMRMRICETIGLDPEDKGTAAKLDSAYPDAGQYFFRNHRKEGGTAFFFDAGRWGSWHCHLSRNSLNLFHGSRMLLIDPGSLDYGNNEIRDYGKYSTSHNTVTINGLSQCIYANPEVLEKCLNETVALIVSSYQGGYQDPVGDGRPVPAEHERIFIWVRDKFALVFDNVNIYNNRNENHIACHWQLPDGEIFHDATDKSVHTCFDDHNVHVSCIYCEPDAKNCIHEGETDPLLGYVSRTGGKLSGGKPAPMLSTEVLTEAEFTRFCHLIVPYNGTRVPSINTSFEKTRYAMKFSISIDGDDYVVASHYFSREYFKTNSAIRNINDTKTFSRVYVSGSRNGNRFMEWTYK